MGNIKLEATVTDNLVLATAGDSLTLHDDGTMDLGDFQWGTGQENLMISDDDRVALGLYGAGAYAEDPILMFWHSKGTRGSPANLDDGDCLGQIYWSGYVDSSWKYLAKIKGHYDAGTGGGEIHFQTNTGASMTDALILSANQDATFYGDAQMTGDVEITGDEGDCPWLKIVQYSTVDYEPPRIALCRSNAASRPTLTDTDDDNWLGEIRFYGVNNGAWVQAAAIACKQDGTPDSIADSVPAWLELCTFKGFGGAPNNHWPMQILLSPTGNVGFGVEEPVSWLHAHYWVTGAECQLRFTNEDTGATSDDGTLVGIDSSEHAHIINKETDKDIYFSTEDTVRARIYSDGKVLVGSSGSVDSQMKIAQSQVTGFAVPVVELEQKDQDQPFIKFIGDGSTSAIKNLTNMNGDGSVEGPKNYSSQNGWSFVGMARMEIQDDSDVLTDQDVWIPLYVVDTA